MVHDIGYTVIAYAEPFKRGARNVPIEYLEPDEVEALLNSIDRSTPFG